MPELEGWDRNENLRTDPGSRCTLRAGQGRRWRSKIATVARDLGGSVCGGTSGCAVMARVPGTSRPRMQQGRRDRWSRRTPRVRARRIGSDARRGNRLPSDGTSSGQVYRALRSAPDRSGNAHGRARTNSVYRNSLFALRGRRPRRRRISFSPPGGLRRERDVRPEVTGSAPPARTCGWLGGCAKPGRAGARQRKSQDCTS